MQKFVISILVLAAAMLGGCRTAPIYKVDAAGIPTGKQMTPQQVESAIVRAGQQLGWSVRPVKPGELEATLVLRTHTAVVSIPYTSTGYSIVYKSSVNLQHEGGQIHNNYNGWVRNLEHRINSELST